LDLSAGHIHPPPRNSNWVENPIRFALPFVRRIKKSGHEYVYIMENYYENGKRRQRVLEYLGPVHRIYRSHQSVALAALEKRLRRKYKLPPIDDTEPSHF
jgi:hypothetical protein